jgi:PAS domain S-box-containing protein
MAKDEPSRLELRAEVERLRARVAELEERDAGHGKRAEQQVLARTSALAETVRLFQEQMSERRSAERELEKQRAYLRKVIDVDPNFIFAKDREGRFTLVNQAVADAYGTTVEDLIGKTDADFNPNEEEVRHFREMDLEVMDSLREHFIPEEMITDSTGQVRWLQTVKRPLDQVGGRARQVLGCATDITARREAQEKLRQSESALRHSQEQLRALAGRLLTAQEEERRRLAREMHDDLTQRLAAVAIEVGKLEQHLESEGGSVPAALGSIKEQVIELSQDVHDLSRQLHPAILEDLGLVDALQSECASFSQRQGIEVRFESRDVPRELPHQTALALYRIAQEALHNVAKHADTRHAEVLLTCADGQVELAVTDAGTGFHPGRAAARKGIGLTGMEERARLLGATFEVDSQPGKGTRIGVRVPVD